MLPLAAIGSPGPANITANNLLAAPPWCWQFYDRPVFIGWENGRRQPCNLSHSAKHQYSGRSHQLRITVRPAIVYGQMQVEVFTAAVTNPSSALGFGTVPSSPAQDELEVNIATKDLRVGVYEIGLIRLHSPTDPAQHHRLTSSLDATSPGDYSKFEDLPTRRGHRISC
jgi:hypothetical protein